MAIPASSMLHPIHATSSWHPAAHEHGQPPRYCPHLFLQHPPMASRLTPPPLTSQPCDTPTGWVEVTWSRMVKKWPECIALNEHGKLAWLSVLLHELGFDTVDIIQQRLNRGLVLLQCPSADIAETCVQALERRKVPAIRGRQIHAYHVTTEDSSALPVNVTLDVPRIPGLTLIPDFLSEEEEANMLTLASSADLKTERELAGGEAPGPAADAADALVRRVIHYGHGFDYVRRGIAWGVPAPSIPDQVTALANRLVDAGHAEKFDQCTLNEYAAGQGISSHVDSAKAFGPTVVSISCGSHIVMHFDPEPGVDETWATTAENAAAAGVPGQAPVELKRQYVLLPRRSAMVITGPARYAWSHGIARRKTDMIQGKLVPRALRLSVTLRSVIEDPDAPVDDTPAVLLSPRLANIAAARGSSAAGHAASDAPASERVAAAPLIAGGTPDVEVTHVQRLYNSIASHFSHTRHSPWPSVATFLNSLPAGSLVADIGCGNGKYMVPSATTPEGHVCAFGCDTSSGLVGIAAARGCAAVVADGVRVPFRSGCADAAISIAVLHHLSTHERRLAAVQELLRVVRPGGCMLVQAWAKEQAPTSKRQFEAQDVMVPWRLQKRFVHTAGAAGEAHLLPDSAEQHDGAQFITLQRYCHVYMEGELPALLQEAGLGQVEIVREWWEAGNWVVQANKASSPS